MREHAQVYGIPWLMPAPLPATHLNHLLTRNAGELLGRVEVKQLLDKLDKAQIK